MIWNLVGSPIFRVVVGVLGVGLIFWLTIQYGQSIERNRQIQQDLQDNIETRERIDDSIEDTIGLDPYDALRQLQQRN